jgi:hypothetical protein
MHVVNLQLNACPSCAKAETSPIKSSLGRGMTSFQCTEFWEQI